VATFAARHDQSVFDARAGQKKVFQFSTTALRVGTASATEAWKETKLKILITGGAGFIGSHLAEHLLAQGDQVWAIDDLSTGSVENVEHLRNHPSFHYYTESIMNNGVVAELIDRCDVIFHLAAAVGVRLIVESPVRTIETNIRGTEVVLNAAAKKKKLVVIASTSEVYGKSTKFPFREEDDLVIGPSVKGRWSYACSKAIDEFLALAYWKERRVPVIVTRFFNTVGPRQTGRYGMVLPNFVRQALADQPITVYGTGQQSRCFAYVGDVVAALRKLINDERAVGEIFNIGSREEVTIEELAHRVRRLTNSRSEITHIPYDQAYEEGFEDMARRVPSLEKIQKWIGYEPTTSLDEIIGKVCEYETSRLALSTGRAA
jgi:UDP-glucose 4-epimerase